MRSHTEEQGFVPAGILAIVFFVLFISTLAFGLWAFVERADFKDNVDKKVDAAVTIAVQQAETAKEADFVEREKSPVRTYKGVATFGSLTIDYPKTWSVYAVEKETGTVLDVFASPGVVSGIGASSTSALRVEIVSNSYDQEVKRFNTKVSGGKVTAVAFRPAKVPSVLGLRIDGEVDTGQQGAVILLPLRDRTIKIYTESPEFLNDFNTIIVPSIAFTP